MTLRPSRRDLLRSVVAGAAGLSAVDLVGRLVDAGAAAPACGAGLGDIEHVVILMQENRSFDHYFGTYPGVRGFNDRSVTQADGSSIFAQRLDATDPTKRLLPFHIDTSLHVPPLPGECTNDVEHQWATQHDSWNGGAMDRFVLAHIDPAVNGPKYGVLTMGHYERADVPVHHALADAFTLCDAYHCSSIGGTDINRILSMCGTMDPDGFDGGAQFLDTQVTNRVGAFGAGGRWVTYPEQLQAKGVSWKVYNTDAAALLDNPLTYWTQYQSNATLAANAFSHSFLDFVADAAGGTLPQVSWLLADSVLDSSHPPAPVEWGEDFIRTALVALSANSAQWARTAVFLTYDENGGFFDHVPPPVSPPKTPGEYISHLVTGSAADTDSRHGRYLDPVGLGFRVPMLIISPFTRGGLISSDLFDHTSMLRFLERRFGAEIPAYDPLRRRPGLTAWRRGLVGDLTSAFNFAATPDATMPSLPLTNRLDPRVLTECVINGQVLSATQESSGTATLPVVSSLPEGYPVPSPQALPVQEASRTPVRRPSGLCAAATASGPSTGLAAGPASSAATAGLSGAGLANTAGTGIGAGVEIAAGAGLLVAAWWARRRRSPAEAAEDVAAGA